MCLEMYSVNVYIYGEVYTKNCEHHRATFFSTIRNTS